MFDKAIHLTLALIVVGSTWLSVSLMSDLSHINQAQQAKYATR